jgi:hypothetical protein
MEGCGMNSNDQQITESLQTGIKGMGLEDTSTLAQVLNGVAEDFKLSKRKVAVLQIAIAEGVLPLIRGLVGKPDVKEQLNTIATALMTKRHLDRRAAKYVVRTWATVLGVLPSPAPAEKPAPAAVWAILRRIPWYVHVLVAIAVIGLAVYYHRAIGLLIAHVFLGLIVLAYAWAVKELLCAVFSWPARKFLEGLAQIKRALDFIPGWIYILVIATLATSDWLGALPYGIRNLSMLLSEQSEQKSRATDSTPPTKTNGRAALSASVSPN